MSESNLEDRAAIHDLFTRYCGALDNGEVEAVVDCFTADAILKSPVIDVSGHDEIRAFAGRFAAQRGAGTQFRHMVSNIAVTIIGNRAAASAYLLVLISKDGNHRSLPPGRYACELIKEDSSQWRFSRRTVFHDHDYCETTIPAVCPDPLALTSITERNEHLPERGLLVAICR